MQNFKPIVPSVPMLLVQFWMTLHQYVSRNTAGAYAWRKVEGVMGDRRILNKLKGNVLRSCVTPALMNALDRMALRETQQEKVQVCETQPGKKNRGS